MIYGTFIQCPYFWYLISGRQKTSFFLFLVFHELQGPKWKKENCTVGFSSGEPQREEELSEESHEAQKEGAHTVDSLAAWGHHLGSRAPPRSGLFSTTPSRQKTNALIFPSSSEAAAAKLLIPSRSEERRVGKECTSWCRSRWSQYH